MSQAAQSSTQVRGAPASSALIVLFCLLGALCEGFDIQAPGIAAGGVTHELHPTPGQLGFFFSAGNLGLLLGAIVGGRLADSLGRKPVMVASIAMFGAFSLATAYAGDMQALTVMRLLTGLGLGGTMPNVVALAAEASKDLRRYAGLATAYLGMPLGGSVASLISAISQTGHWRMVFIAGGVAPLVIAAAMLVLMPRPEPPAKAAGVAPASYLQGLFGEGRWWATPVLWVGFLAVNLMLHLLLNWLPLLVQGLGLSHSEAAYAQVGFNVGAAAGSLMIGLLADAGRRGVGALGLVLGAPAILVLLAGAGAHPEVVFPLAALLGAVVVGSSVMFFTHADQLYPASSRGAGVGAGVGAGRVGSIAGPALAAALVGAGRTPPQVLMGLMPIVAIYGVGLFLLDRRARRA